MQLFERIQLGDRSTRRRTSDGYLVAMGKAARTGIQVYAGAEVGRPDLAQVRVYRPADEVFSRDSMGTYPYKPVTNDHPVEPVTAANWKDHAIGFVGDEVAKDGEHIRIPLMLADAASIDALDAGKSELSAGYSCRLDWQDGVTPEGDQYDAIQRDIKINHVALVGAGRAGTARVEDGKDAPRQPKGERSMTDANKQSLVVDGLTVSLDARDAEIVKRTIDSLTSKLADAEKAKEDMEKERAKEDEEHEKDMAKKDAMIDELKGQVLDTAALDARVQARADLISTAKAIVGDSLEFKGKADADIRKAVVTARLGDEAIAGKTEAYIDARFDILAESAAKGDPIRDAAFAASGRPANLNSWDAAFSISNVPLKKEA